MPIHFKKSSQFEDRRFEIEQYLFDTVFEIERNDEIALRSVEHFAKSIDHLVDTLEEMYQHPKARDLKGEKSFPIRSGRYRIYYKIKILASTDLEITFTDIEDNKQSNLDRFPEHFMTFDDEN
jgi:mRNA-degrading endonuclease RelE of RelBE toxin-antitoxin system